MVSMYSVLVVSVLFWLCIITCKSQITTRSEKGKTGSLADQAIYYEFKSELKFYRDKLQELQKEVDTLKNGEAKNAGGLTFVNWGRKECDVNTTTVYSGYGGKALYKSTGSGVNYQCLHNNPDWNGDEKSGFQANGRIYGVEYWANEVPNIFSDSDIHKGLPCCVCETYHYSQSLMIPGKQSCPESWIMQYKGILMSERFSHVSPSEYICVNREYEFIDGSAGNHDSGYVIPVEVICGALPCPPYNDGYELSCVVCTK